MVEVKGTFSWTAGDPEKPFDAKALGKALDRNPSGHLYHFRYPLKDEVPVRKDFIVVATTRPETMLGDTAVAVHPEDERYKDADRQDRWCCRWSGARSRSSPTSTPIPRRARAR